MSKYAGKYESPEALEAAYKELESKLGAHGNEKAAWQQEREQYQAAVNELTNYASQLTPVATWYRQNLPRIQQWWQGQAQGRPQQGVAQPQAQGFAMPQGWEQLNDQQRYALMVQAAGATARQHALQTLQQQGAAYARQVQEHLANQYKHSTDVLWRTFERILPKEQLDRARQYHEASLKYTDASKLNPMDLAREHLDMTAERDTLKGELDELKKKEEARQKAATPSLGATPTIKAFDKGEQTAKLPSREERFRSVIEDTSSAVGADAMRDAFPALR